MKKSAAKVIGELGELLDGAPGAAMDRLESLWGEAYEIWLAGGWAMIGIALVAIVMFGVGMQVYFNLRAKGFRSVPEDVWRQWIRHPAEREGAIGNLLDRVTNGKTVEETAEIFRGLRATELDPFERDLRIVKTCVSAAPLVGLLGTVTGMLATFGALAEGSGGDQTMGLVAKGISEALITTETGLVIALPGMFFQYRLARQHDSYQAFLAHLESVCNQVLHRESNQREQAAAHQVAVREVARRLQRRLQIAESASVPATTQPTTV